MKKILLLLCVVALAFVLCLSASAAEEKVVIDNVVYELITDNYKYYGGNPYGPHYAVTDFFEDEELSETTTEITITDEIDGIKVLGIDTNELDPEYDGTTFYYGQKYPTVKEVILPTTLKYIGVYAFTFFPSVEELLLPAELDFISTGGFSRMRSLKRITLPKNITSVNYEAFYGCDNLEKVVLQGDVTVIGEYAFGSCSKLTSINLPSTLKTIKRGAFSNTGLKKIVLPAGVDTHNSFYDCQSLKNVVYIGTEPVNTLEIDDFSGCKNLKNIYLRGIATKKIKFGYQGSLFKAAGLKNIYFEGSEALWNKLTQKDERKAIASNDIHTGFYYKHEHSFALDGAPTCKKGGTYTCKCICGDSYKVTLPKNPNNHNFGGWKVTKEATCAVTGLRKRTCKTCGYVQQAKIRKVYLGTPYARVKESETTDSKIVVEWEKADNATGYIIYETNKKETKFTKVATLKADQTSYTFKNLQPGKRYRYAIEAYNIDKNGNKAVSEKEFFAEWTYSNEPPKNLKAVSTEPGVIVLTWDATGPDVSYDTYCGISEEHVRSCSYGSILSRSYYSSTNKETIKNLKSGVTYYIKVTTYGEKGIRLSSEIISIVVK